MNSQKAAQRVENDSFSLKNCLHFMFYLSKQLPLESWPTNKYFKLEQIVER